MVRFYFLAAICILSLGLASLCYLKGRSDGRIELLDKTVKAYERRSKIDNDVQDLSRFDLCISLGGMPGECAQLRGMVKTAKAK